MGKNALDADFGAFDINDFAWGLKYPNIPVRMTIKAKSFIQQINGS